MAKRSVSKTNWKFVVLVVGLIMLGISVWAVNNKLNTLNSSAAVPDICKEQYKECTSNCGSDGGMPSGWSGNKAEARRWCIKRCIASRNKCIGKYGDPTSTPTPTP